MELSGSASGGLILICNRPLTDLPELRALATRIEVHRLEVTEAEMSEKMRELAGAGYRHNGKLGSLEPAECLEVTEHLLRECRAGRLSTGFEAAAEELPDFICSGNQITPHAIGGT